MTKDDEVPEGTQPSIREEENVLLAQPDLQTLEEAIAAIAQEEVRLKLMPSTTSSPKGKSSLAVLTQILPEEEGATTVETLDTSSESVRST